MRNNPKIKEAIVSFRASNLEKMQLELKAMKNKQNLSQYLRELTLNK